MEAFLPINSSVDSMSSICKTIDEPSAPPEVQNQNLQHQHCPLAWKLAGEVTFLQAMSLKPYQWLWLLKKLVFVKRNELQNTKCLGLSDLPLIQFLLLLSKVEVLKPWSFSSSTCLTETSSQIAMADTHLERKAIITSRNQRDEEKLGSILQPQTRSTVAPEERILCVKISVIFHY